MKKLILFLAVSLMASFSFAKEKMTAKDVAIKTIVSLKENIVLRGSLANYKLIDALDGTQAGLYLKNPKNINRERAEYIASVALSKAKNEMYDLITLYTVHESKKDNKNLIIACPKCELIDSDTGLPDYIAKNRSRVEKQYNLVMYACVSCN